MGALCHTEAGQKGRGLKAAALACAKIAQPLETAGAPMKAILTLLALTVTLAACTPNDAPAGPSLAGTRWVLKAMPGWESAKAAQVPTLVFQSETQVGGRAGCNIWGGTYEHKGAKIRFSAMMMTEMACEYGMDVEQLYINALERTRAIGVDGDTLTLSDEMGGELARFFRASTAVPP
jgi:heat shock protein HslJ